MCICSCRHCKQAVATWWPRYTGRPPDPPICQVPSTAPTTYLARYIPPIPAIPGCSVRQDTVQSWQLDHILGQVLIILHSLVLKLLAPQHLCGEVGGTCLHGCACLGGAALQGQDDLELSRLDILRTKIPQRWWLIYLMREHNRPERLYLVTTSIQVWAKPHAC